MLIANARLAIDTGEVVNKDDDANIDSHGEFDAKGENVGVVEHIVTVGVAVAIDSDVDSVDIPNRETERVGIKDE